MIKALMAKDFALPGNEVGGLNDGKFSVMTGYSPSFFGLPTLRSASRP